MLGRPVGGQASKRLFGYSHDRAQVKVAPKRGSMVALILGIAAAVGWITFDVLVSLATSAVIPDRQWWAFLIGGAGLAVLTVSAEVLDYRSHQRTDKKHSDEHTALAAGELKIWEQLQEVTKTTGESTVTTVDAATRRIESLEDQVAELRRAQWRKITPVQRAKFLETLQNMKIENNSVELLVVRGDPEADSYATQLAKLLRDAGFTCGRDPTREFGPFDEYGLIVLVKNVNALEQNADWLLRGLKYSDIDYHLTSEHVVANARTDYLALRVGPKAI